MYIKSTILGKEAAKQDGYTTGVSMYGYVEKRIEAKQDGFETNQSNYVSSFRNKILVSKMHPNRQRQPSSMYAAKPDGASGPYRIRVEGIDERADEEEGRNSTMNDHLVEKIAENVTVTKSPTTYVFESVNENIHYLPSKEDICVTPRVLEQLENQKKRRMFFIAGQMNTG